jgi:hypothetical protein
MAITRDEVRQAVIKLSEALASVAELSAKEQENCEELDAQIAQVKQMLKSSPFCENGEMETLKCDQ